VIINLRCRQFPALEGQWREVISGGISMADREKGSTREPGHTRDSKMPSEKSTVGTEAAVKGGKDEAKRQAERDWQQGPKESGE
jgi:hypothetical protein